MNNAAVLKSLMVRDIRVLRTRFYHSMMDGMIYLSIAYIIYAKLLPIIGFKQDMIAPLFWGMLVMVLIHESYDCARAFAIEIAHDPSLDFYTTLPLGFYWLLARYILSNSLQLLVNSMFLFLGGELLFGPQLPSSLGRIVLFLGTYVTMILFFATFSLAVGTVTNLAWFRDNMWSRIFIPFVFGGCLYVPWYATYRVAPQLAILFLASPFTYVVEGLRAAVFGQEGYISLALCIAVMVCLIVVQIVCFRRWFIKRIDPVIEL